MRLSLLCLAWLAGIALSAAGVLEGAALLLGGGLAIWGIAQQRFPWWPIIALALLLTGGLRHRSAEATLVFPVLEALRGQEAVVVARVSQEPEARGPRQRLLLAVEIAGLTEAANPTSGSVIAWLPLYPQYHQHDRLELRGRLEPPPAGDGFDIAGLYARRGIAGVLYDPQTRQLGADSPVGLGTWAATARRALGSALTAGLPEPEASLAAALLFGVRTTLPPAVAEAFQTTGTAHLLAVSGYNRTLIASYLGAIFVTAVGRRRALWPSLALVWAYTTLVGDQPPVLRAAVMASLVLVATHFGRPTSPIAALVLAAALFAAIDPFVLWEPSFQLSFLAVAGLVLLAQPWQQHIEALFEAREGRLGRWRMPLRFIADTLAVTIAATLITAPIIVLLFQRLALISPLANLLAQPLVPLGMLLSVPVALVGLVAPSLAPYVAAPAWLSLRAITEIVERLALLPGASWTTPPISGLLVALLYGAIALWLLGQRWGLWSALQRARRDFPRVRLEVFLAALSVVVWAAVMLQPTADTVSLDILDVGQGEALLVTGPDGQRVLVDGGPDPQRLLHVLGQRLPFWERRFAALIFSHPDADHLTGLVAVVERYQVGLLIEGDTDESALYQAWEEAVLRKRVQRIRLMPGQSLSLNEASMMLIAPEQGQEGADNDRSLVLRLAYGDISFLLTGDIEAEGEEGLLRSLYPLDSTVLKVPHHGSRSSSTLSFLEAVSPAAGVISVGARNPFGHPSSEVLARFEALPLYRTDRHGTITFQTDGRQLWVRTER